jgi:hypothetical protein
MRLIDAEGLKCAVRKKFHALPDRCEINELINAAPTVEAIPLEWLNDKMQKPQITCDNPFGFVLAEWLEEQI